MNDSQPYRHLMTDPGTSGWLRYWLFLAWERTPRSEAIGDARQLLSALSTQDQALAVPGKGRSYWLQGAYRQSLKRPLKEAVSDARHLLDVLEDRAGTITSAAQPVRAS
jgi:hypothetical protein